MTGMIDKLIPSDNGFHHYVFVKHEGKVYFLHRKNLENDWNEIEMLLKTGNKVKVEFDEEKTEKGPKAIRARIV